MQLDIINYLNKLRIEKAKEQCWKQRDVSLFVVFSFVIVSLLIGTSIYSDDYSGIPYGGNRSLLEAITPRSNTLTVPLTQYFFHIFYYMSSYDFMLPVILAKIFWAIVSFYCITKYLSLWLDLKFCMVFTFLWITLPIHDATFYWLIGQYLIVSCAFIFYAAYELERGNKKRCILFVALGSWVSYGSPAIAFSLYSLFLLRGTWKKGLYLLIPNLLYCVYYIICTKYFTVYVSRIRTDLGLVHLCKNLGKQFFSFLDASCGPSMALKIYYLIINIDLFGLILSVLILALIIWLVGVNSKNNQSSSVLVLLFSFILFFNIAMFTLTGAYPQLSFNLGNRVTAYSCLVVLFSFMIILSRYRYGNYVLIWILLISCYGNRNKFLKIEVTQEQIVYNMGKNLKLKNHSIDIPLFIEGNQYHKLGPFSDVEFLSGNWVAKGILRSHYGENYNVYSLNKKWVVENETLFDRKGQVRVSIPSEGIHVYDTVLDKFKVIRPNEIQPFILNLEKNKRHWIQFIENESVKKFIKDKIKPLSYDL